jgi:tRNA A58 N-methylase Trm61
MELRVENNLKIIREQNKYPYEYGTFLYDYIIENKPEFVVELGTGHGFVTMCMAIALKENNFGSLASYDYYQEHNWCTDITLVQKRIDEVGLTDWVELRNMDAYKWLEKQKTQRIDMFYLDIHNDGNVIEHFMDNSFIQEQMKNGMPLFFEGGANVAREAVCATRNQKKFSDMKYEHEILYDMRTGLSVIWGAK